MQHGPDCSPPIRAWVDRMVDSLVAELGDNCDSLLLHGSLAQGTYHPPKSDVDVLAVTRDALPASARESFARLCARLSKAGPTVGGLEISVVTRCAARAPEHPIPMEAHYGDDHYDEVVGGTYDWARARRDPDLAAHFQATRESGIVLYGEPIEGTIGSIPPDAFWDAVLADLEWILEGEHILESPYYGILNCCRLMMVRTGAYPGLVPSKLEAGIWASRTLPARLRGVANRAVEVYRDSSPIEPRARRTGGVAWEVNDLLAFRDHVRALDWRRDSVVR